MLPEEEQSPEHRGGRKDQGLLCEDATEQDGDGESLTQDEAEYPVITMASRVSPTGNNDTPDSAASWDTGTIGAPNASVFFEFGCLEVASNGSGCGSKSPSTQLLCSADSSSAQSPSRSVDSLATIDPGFLFKTSSSSSSSIDDLGFSFPDTCLLPVPELTILRAFVRIATRLGCKDSLWDINSTSPFFANPSASTSHLPKTWQPTPSQMLVHHHPFLDFLPCKQLFGPSTKTPCAVAPLHGGRRVCDIEYLTKSYQGRPSAKSSSTCSPFRRICGPRPPVPRLR